MAQSAFGELPEENPRGSPRDNPRQNPCAQCGQPIAAPDWVEPGPHRVTYLWSCPACDYRFEAIAFFDDRKPDREPLAA